MAIYGRAGTLKSWLSLEQAFALATGQMWLAYPCIESRVLIMQAEVTESNYIERLIAYSRNVNGLMPDNIWMDNDLTMDLSGTEGMNLLENDIEEVSPDVIIIDCLYKIVSGSVSNEIDLKKVIANVDRIRQAYGTAFVFIHHPRKDQSSEKEDHIDKGFEEMLTSSIFGDWLETIIKVTSVPPNQDQPDTIRLDFQKLKNARQFVSPIQVRFNRDRAQFTLS